MFPSRQSSVYSPAYGKNSNLLKKIPPNPRYKHVKPVIDSGYNVRKYMEAVQESQRNINYKKDECFRRIKLATFVKLVIEVFSEISDDFFSKENIENNRSAEQPNQDVAGAELQSAKSVPLSESVFSSVVVGVGEMDLHGGVKKDNTRPAQPAVDPLNFLPYLLLDVRDKDDFLACSIITGKSYPFPMLSRAYTYETKDLLKYKNISHKLIIIYDEDESIAPRVASTLVQRGYDNIYMLSGGLRLALEKFPKGLIRGNLPLKRRASKPDEVYTVRSSEGYATARHPVSTSQIKKFFTQDDIALLQQYLDKYTSAVAARMESLSRSCSRMSRAEGGIHEAASRSRMGVKSAPSKSRPPWK